VSVKQNWEMFEYCLYNLPLTEYLQKHVIELARLDKSDNVTGLASKIRDADKEILDLFFASFREFGNRSRDPMDALNHVLTEIHENLRLAAGNNRFCFHYAERNSLLKSQLFELGRIASISDSHKRFAQKMLGTYTLAEMSDVGVFLSTITKVVSEFFDEVHDELVQKVDLLCSQIKNGQSDLHVLKAKLIHSQQRKF
jgi:hypothetical protein